MFNILIAGILGCAGGWIFSQGIWSRQPATVAIGVIIALIGAFNTYIIGTL
jgi:hypothetical protein